MKLSMNEKNALHLMRATFSSGLTFLSEAMQNARRAGASKVRFDITRDNDTQAVNIVIYDDGEGVKDFADLMTVAQSGWNEAIQKHDKPFGAGFLSIIACCEHGEAESHGIRMTWNTAELFDGGKSEFADVGTGQGTLIRLFNVCATSTLNNSPIGVYDMERYIRARGKGFPIDIYLNNDRLDRNEATGYEMVSVETEMGKLCFFEGTSIKRPDTPRLYLQGLPINVGTSREADLPIVLHLNSEKYEARMPDREQLVGVDKPTIDKQAKAYYPALAKALFEKRKGRILEVPTFHFILENAPELMKQATMLPPGIFDWFIGESGWDYTPSSDRSESYFGRHQRYGKDMPAVIDSEYVKSADVVILSNRFDNNEQNVDIFARIMEQDGRTFMTCGVSSAKEWEAMPEWLPRPFNNSTDYSDGLVFFEPVEKEGSFTAHGVELTGLGAVATVFGNLEAIKVKWYDEADEDDRVLISETTVYSSWFDPESESMFLVGTSDIPQSVCAQSEDYAKDCDDWDHTDLDYEAIDRDLAIANANLRISLCGEDPEKVIENLIALMTNELRERISRHVWGKLVGRTITVTDIEMEYYNSPKFKVSIT